MTIDNKYLDDKRRFKSRQEYGKATLALVVKQNEARARREEEKRRLMANAEIEEESERAVAVRNMETVWMEQGVPQVHRFVVEGLIDTLRDDDLHQVCVTEIVLAEDMKGTSQMVIKYYNMRLKCIEKISEINEKLIQLEEVSGDEEMSLKLTQEVYLDSFRLVKD